MVQKFHDNGSMAYFRLQQRMTSLAKCPTHGFWKRSATLLLMGQSKSGKPTVLTVKRSAKAKFMPNNVVFPGGICELGDFSEAWYKVFPELKKFEIHPEAKFPDIFKNDSKLAKLDEISAHVGLRITAIRELLEETGLLLDSKSGVQTVSEEIRDKVNQNPDQFCHILKEIDAVPDIWALHDWCTWLTPIGLNHSTRRYDTQFYVAVVDNVDDLSPSSDNSEVSAVQFWDIGEITTSFITRKIKVAPPQMYELGRLLNFDSLDELREYAKTRDRLGTERMFPVNINCLDGSIRVLPGDSLYPDVPDLLGTLPPINTCVGMTIDECMRRYSKHHRIVVRKDQQPTIKLNISLNLEQATPLGIGSKSRL